MCNIIYSQIKGTHLSWKPAIYKLANQQPTTKSLMVFFTSIPRVVISSHHFTEFRLKMVGFINPFSKGFMKAVSRIKKGADFLFTNVQ